MKNIDIIGDIHGHSDELVLLLEKMGYKESKGVYAHPENKVIFLGDLIDRGPKQKETLQIVRRMVEERSATCLMGNHEFNAICFHTPSVAEPGKYLRPHNKKNLKQHNAFLQKFKQGSKECLDIINWFKTLPLYLELDSLISVHACWDQRSIDKLKPYLNSENRVENEELFYLAACPGTEQFLAIESVLKGPEIKLPDGFNFSDKDGTIRDTARIKWWLDGSQTFHSGTMLDDIARKTVPDKPISPGEFISYSDKNVPVFFGHYWFRGNPELCSPHATCLDYSVARGGKLCAYRWQGEKRLKPEHFVTIDALS
ncbi:metallophosphoesterase [Candidatus Riflebacteria bacterium]